MPFVNLNWLCFNVLENLICKIFKNKFISFVGKSLCDRFDIYCIANTIFPWAYVTKQGKLSDNCLKTTMNMSIRYKPR